MSEASAAAKARKFWIIVTALFIVALASIVFVFVQTSTRISATLDTSSIQFTAAVPKANAGLFNSETPLEITVADFDSLEDVDRSTGRVSNLDGAATCSFSNAKLAAIDMSKPLHVSLEVVDKALLMKLTRDPGDRAVPFVQVDAVGTGVSPDGCVKEERSHRGWFFYGKNGNSTLTLTLRPVSGRLDPEKNIHLESGTSVTFWNEDNSSGILGSADGLKLTKVDRKIALDEGQSVEINNLSDAILQRIQPENDRIVVVLRGTAESLNVDERSELASWGEVIGSNPAVVKYSALGSGLLACIGLLLNLLKSDTEK